VAIKKDLSINQANVSVGRVSTLLNQNSNMKIGSKLIALRPRTQDNSVPDVLYSEENDLFRISLYRNYVVHYNNNPFHFRIEGGASASLRIDPRDGTVGASEYHVFDELDRFLALVNYRCEEIINLI